MTINSEIDLDVRIRTVFEPLQNCATEREKPLSGK